jgi:hypothetical protein
MARELKGEGADLEGAARRLFARTASRVPDLRLTHFDLLSLGLADLEGAAAHVLCLIHFIFRQNFSPETCE